ncbi:hypothetical protein [Metabacillus sp. 84]|uniref:hypothetical protein n=1 Tax=unclassified Metabacillus TaxID=2675274 RepID=UPI003CF91BD3
MKNKFTAFIASGMLLSGLALPWSASANEVQKPVQPAVKGVYSDEWVDAGIERRSTKFEKYSAGAVIQTLGFALSVPTASVSNYLAGLVNMVVLGEYKVVYLKDHKSFRMAGATLQVKHEIEVYSDSHYQNKIGEYEMITNDTGGPK